MKKSLAWVVVALVAGAGTAAADICRLTDGGFIVFLEPPPGCTSPVGLCLHGFLDGNPNATYDLTIDDLVCEDPDDPNKCTYTGTSITKRSEGGLFVWHGTDTGILTMTPAEEPSPIEGTTAFSSSTFGRQRVFGKTDFKGHITFASGRGNGLYGTQACRAVGGRPQAPHPGS